MFLLKIWDDFSHSLTSCKQFQCPERLAVSPAEQLHIETWWLIAKLLLIRFYAGYILIVEFLIISQQLDQI